MDVETYSLFNEIKKNLLTEIRRQNGKEYDHFESQSNNSSLNEEKAILKKNQKSVESNKRQRE